MYYRYTNAAYKRCVEVSISIPSLEQSDFKSVPQAATVYTAYNVPYRDRTCDQTLMRCQLLPTELTAHKSARLSGLSTCAFQDFNE